MRFILRTLQASVFAGLTVALAVTANGQASAARPVASGSAMMSSRPMAGGAASAVRDSREISSRMARRLAGPGARTVTVEDVVEGGVYFEDPVSGKLILGEAPPRATNAAPAESPRAATRAAASPSVGRPVAGPTRMTSETTSRLATRSAAPPTVPPPAAIEDVTMDGFDFGETSFDDDVCYDGSCGHCADCLAPCGLFFPAGNLELSAGVQGFTGPANWQAAGGSFGFYEGLNWGMPLPLFGGLGAQAGFRATQSNLSGSAVSDATRRQAFVTAGLFRRVDVGLQGGVVIDWLSDGWHRNLDLVNVRMELSWMIDGTHELGFWGAAGTKNSQDLAPVEPVVIGPWETTDLYAFFYRYNFGDCQQGDARLFAGWSGQGDGLIGADVRLPLSMTWAMETNVAYLIPSEGSGTGFGAGHVQESWNIAAGLVWQPGRRLGRGDSYYRPLFRVADNGTFMMDRVSP